MDQAQFNKLKQEQLDLETQINAELGKGAAANKKFLKESRELFDEQAKRLRGFEQERKIQDDISKTLRTHNSLLSDTTNSLAQNIKKNRESKNANQVITDSIEKQKDKSYSSEIIKFFTSLIDRYKNNVWQKKKWN